MSVSLVLGALLAAPPSPQTLLRQLVRDPALRGAFLGVYVTNRSGRVLLQQQADRMMMPASNQKLLTCVYAVTKLGWQYRHQTKIWRRDPEIWIEAGNDPLLQSVDLVAAGGGHFERAKVILPYQAQYGMGWEIDDLTEKYLPKVSPLTVDGGQHVIRYSSDKAWLEPANSSLRIELSPSTGAAKVAFDFDRRTLSLTGSWPPPKPVSIPQPDPVAVAADLVADSHTVVPAPLTDAPDAVITGRPLADAIRICMIESDNRLAEMLLMSAGGGETIRASAEAMERFWATQGVRKGEIRAVDGSGLSRHNLVTPRALARAMLVALKHGMATRRSLVTPGNGTMRSRLTGLRFSGKTGTLDTVTCLTGILEDRGIVLSVLINHVVSPVRSAMAAVDRFVKGLASYYAVGTKNASSNFHDPNPAESRHSSAHAHRLDGSGSHGDAAFPRADRRTQSAHATPDRAR